MMPSAQQREAVARAAHEHAADAFALRRLLEGMGFAITFAHDASMHVAAKEVSEITFLDKGVRVTSGFLGLTGATSPLPEETLCALQEVLDTDEGQDLAQWVRLLEHRLLELLHRGMSLGTFDANIRASLQDAPSSLLQDGTQHAQGASPRLRLSTWAALRQSHSTDTDLVWAIKQVLRHHGILAQVRLLPLLGRPCRLQDRQLCRLGVRSHILGESAVLGPYAGSLQRTVRVQLTPDDEAFFRLSQCSEALLAADLCAMLRALLPQPVQAEVVVRVRSAFRQQFRLGEPYGEAAPQPPVQPGGGFGGLGVSTFLQGNTAQGATDIFWPLGALTKQEQHP